MILPMWGKSIRTYTKKQNKKKTLQAVGLIMIYKRYSITKDQGMVASFSGIEKK